MKPRIPEDNLWEQTLDIFHRYRECLLGDEVFFVVFHAVKKGKLPQVLEIFKSHWENYLSKQKIHIVSPGSMETMRILLEAYKVVLGINRNAFAWGLLEEGEE